MKNVRNNKGFTLIELLVTISIISLLTSVLLPSLNAARELAKSTKCLSNLSALATTSHIYLSENNDYYWPLCITKAGVNIYFWGSAENPVDPSASPFMNACENNLAILWCPCLEWGAYIPQGGVTEPTTTYGFNSRHLTTKKNQASIPDTSQLFVFSDSGMYWKPNGVKIFQNSTYLEPVSGNPVQQPTNHFRHMGKNNSLCADGHAESYKTEGGRLDTATMLGFVGTQNYPHYEQ